MGFRPFHGHLHCVKLVILWILALVLNILSQKCSTLNIKFSNERFYYHKRTVNLEVAFRKIAHLSKVFAHTGLTILDCRKRKRRHWSWKSQNWRAVWIFEWFKSWLNRGLNVLKGQQSRELRGSRAMCPLFIYTTSSFHGKVKFMWKMFFMSFQVL